MITLFVVCNNVKNLTNKGAILISNGLSVMSWRDREKVAHIFAFSCPLPVCMLILRLWFHGTHAYELALMEMMFWIKILFSLHDLAILQACLWNNLKF